MEKGDGSASVDAAFEALGEERRFDRAWSRLEQERQSDRGIEPETELLVADLMRACGRNRRALSVYERLEQSHIWAWVWRRGLWPPQEPREREALEREIEQKLLDCKDPVDRVAVLWLQAETRTGRDLDDWVTDEDLAAAGSLLGEARELARDAAWLLPEIARVVRFRAGRDENHAMAMRCSQARINELRSELEPAGKTPVGVPLREPARGLDYEEGRLALLNREWGRAATIFAQIVERDHSHQHARVWRIYALRLSQNSNDELLEQIDTLLDSSLSREAVAMGEVPGELDGELVYGDPYPRVCQRELVAMLLSERAAILEPTHSEEALRNYELALELRPAMLLAKRGLLRCLDAAGERSRSQRAAHQLLDEARADETFSAVAAELFVEVGRFELARWRLSTALEHFEQAIEIFPIYGYAYERKLVVLAMKGEHERARQAGEAALTDSGKLRGETGVRIELANALLELGETSAALDLYSCHTCDATNSIRDRASAGCVHAHRYARNYDLAQQAIDAAHREDDKVGFRLWNASGRLACDLGDFSTALDHFERGLELRPREPVLISSVARALRLLGRPSDAYKFLQQRRSTMGVFKGETSADLGWAELECARPEDALAHFKQARARNKRDEIALRGIIFVESHSWTHAISQRHEVERLRRTLGLGDDASGAALTELGCRCAARGALVDARLLFAEANERCASASQMITQMLTQGHACIEAHALGEAEFTLEKLETMEGARYRDEPNVRLLRAKWHLAQSESETAARIFAEVGKLWPRSHLAVFGHAAAASRRGDGQGALRDLKRLIERLRRECDAQPARARVCRDNDSILARELLVRIRLHASREGDEEARAECQQILAMEPRSSQAYLGLGVIAARHDETRQAQLYVAQAAAVAPTRIEPIRERGWIALLGGDHASAESALESADRLDPHDSRLHLLRGLLYLQRDERTDAILTLRRAAALDPSNPDCAAALADALDRDGEREEALQILSAASARLPPRDTLLLRLASARINHAAAINEKRQLRNRLLEEAAQEARSATALARDFIDKAEVHYHTGVICHARGQRREAQRELKRCLQSNPSHFQAQRAQAIIGSDREDDGTDLHARMWANLLGATGLVLLVLLGVDVTLHATHSNPPLAQRMVGPIGIAALVSLVVAALIPRLTSLNVRGVGSLTVTPSLEESAKAAPEILFRRLPLNTLSAPGTGQLSPITPDTAGLASS